MTKSDSLWFHFDSNVAYNVTLIYWKKKFFKIGLLSYLSELFCVAHAHTKPDQHNENFVVLDEFMSKC